MGKHIHGVGERHHCFVGGSLVGGDIGHLGSCAEFIGGLYHVAHFAIEGCDGLDGGVGAQGDGCAVERAAGCGRAAVERVVNAGIGGGAAQRHVHRAVVGAGCRAEGGLAHHDFTRTAGCNGGLGETVLGRLFAAQHGKRHAGGAAGPCQIMVIGNRHFTRIGRYVGPGAA